MFSESLAEKSYSDILLSSTDTEILQSLYEKGVLPEETIELLLKIHQKTKLDIIEILLDYGFLSHAKFTKFIETHFGVKIADLTNVKYRENLASLIPVHILLKNKFLPVSEDEQNIYVVTRNFLEEKLKSQISEGVGTTKNIIFSFATTSAIEASIQKVFLEEGKLEIAIKNINLLDVKTISKKEYVGLKDPIVELVELLFETAVSFNSSYINITPKELFLTLSYRMDGVLKEMPYICKEQETRIINRIKILFGMKQAESSNFQTGTLELKLLGKIFTLNASASHSKYGENIVIALTEKGINAKSFEELGLSKNNIQKIIKISERPEGIIRFVGTQTAKEESLVSIVHHLSSKPLNIVGLSAVLPYNIPSISYLNCSFEEALKQNPDVIITEGLSNIASNGIKVLTLLNETDILSSISKNGIEGAIGIIGQKFVRKLCESCKIQMPITSEHLSVLRLSKTDVKNIYTRGTCKDCFDTGYKGKIIVCEVLVMEAEIEDVIKEGVSSKVMFEAFKKKGFATMFEDARLKILQGITDIDEVKRVISF